MKGLNKLYLIGHIGQDPELRHTAAGLPIVNLSVATNRSEKKGTEWTEVADWHRITAFDKTAEYLAKYAKKGGVIAVECSVRPSKWTDRGGIVHYTISLLVGKVLWLTSKRVENTPDNFFPAPIREEDPHAGEEQPPLPDEWPEKGDE